MAQTIARFRWIFLPSLRHLVSKFFAEGSFIFPRNLLMVLFLFSFTSGIYAGDLQRTVSYPGLAKAIEAEQSGEWFFCGDNQLDIESKHFAKHFFIGPENIGIVIKGLSGFQLSQWSRMMTAAELNKKIIESAAASTLLVVRQPGLNVTKVKLLRSKVEVQNSQYDCKKSVPKNMQCTQKNEQARIGCCEEGVNKDFKFTLDYSNPESPEQIWKLNYYPGDGNTSVVAAGGKGLVRFCTTSGLIFIK